MANSSEISKVRDLEKKIEYARSELKLWERAVKITRRGKLQLMDDNDKPILVDATVLEASFYNLKDQSISVLTIIIKAYETEYFDLTGSHYGK